MTVSLRRFAVSAMSFCCAALVAGAAVLPAFAQTSATAEADAPAESPADDAAELETVAVAALSGHQTVLSDIDFLGGLAGNPGLSGIVTFFSGGALEVLDGSRPIGVVVQTDGAQFTPIVCLPVADIDRLLQVGENFNLEPIDAGNGVYELEANDQVLFFKNVGQWTFAAQSVDALDLAPADPAATLQSLVDSYDLGVTLRAANVPEIYREIALEQLREGMEQGLEQEADESDEDFAKRRELAQAQVEQIEDLIKGLDTLTVGWNIDAENRQTFLEVVAIAAPKTDMALAMTAYRPSSTGVSGFHRPESAASLLTHGDTPDELLEKQQEQIEAAIATFRKQADKAISESEEGPLADPDMREALRSAANDLIDVYAQMARDGDAELAGSLDLSGEGWDLIAAAKVSDPEKVESAFKKVAEAASKDESFPGVEWGYAEHAGVKLHGMSAPVPENGQARDTLGESVRLIMGVGNERVYFAAGPRGEEALKAAIDRSASMADQEVMPAEVIVSLKQVLTAAKKVAPPQQAGMIGMVLDGLEQTAEGKDHLRVTVEAAESGRGARIRYLLEEGVLAAIGKAAAAAGNQMQGGAPGGF
ncbi:hypothetical protein [Botrimarina sp.]|uniref:hypothetical protein n=1 Tax=Botrimarina sp. TaxID=2795802 RepID=UPI0032ECE8AA